MEHTKSMKLLILEKFLQDDSRKKGIRYVYIYMLTFNVVKSCHVVAGNGLLYLEVWSMEEYFSVHEQMKST